jgi:N-acetylneuraminic acid mutarotase
MDRCAIFVRAGLIALSAALLSCGGGDTSDRFSLGGTVTGLTPGSYVVLQNNGASALAVSGNGSFILNAPFAGGSSYALSVQTQPAGETCTVSNGSGTLRSAQTGVLVQCTANNYKVAGTVAGLLAGNALVLQITGQLNVGQPNGGPIGTGQVNPPNQLTVTGNVGFAFGTSVPSGTNFAVTVLASPPGQSCSVSNGSGTVSGADVINVAVQCSDNTYNVGASVSGLVAQASVVLQDNGTDLLTIGANGVPSNFNTPIASGSAYAVAVATQPAGENCAVTGNASGIVASANVLVTVLCTPLNYTVGGSIAGLLPGNSLSLQDNGTDTAGDLGNGAFVFAAPVPSGSNYAVAVLNQAPGQSCSVANGSGTVLAANVRAVAVSCSDNAYNIGVSVSGPVGTGLVLQDNGVDSLAIAAAGNFNFNAPVASGSNYAVTVLTQPVGARCVVSNGAGTVSAVNVTSIPVVCLANVWTWQGGPDVAALPGVYGTQGSAASANLPGARYGAATWTDASGNFWLFGGSGYDSAGTFGYLNDLWTYAPATGLWTWVGGANVANTLGSYGTLGSTASGNAPGARYGAAAWIDASGNLWLFGGYGYDSPADGASGDLNDLWMYNPGAASWTWMAGASVIDTAGVYQSDIDAPGARSHAATWIDAAGTLWLFGGNGYDVSGALGDLNDLWSYSPKAGTWRYVGGSDAVGAGGVYVSTGPLTPGARDSAITWIDASGNLWLFGGYRPASLSGPVPIPAGYFNDLWEYTPAPPGAVGAWVWAGGSSSTDAAGIYGSGAPSVPGARASGAAWIDAAGTFWLFGGNGYDAQGAVGALSDVWSYTPGSGTWSWVNGANLVNAPASYGIQGQAALANTPGARYGVAGWRDATGNFWLLGGYPNAAYPAQVGGINDVWEFTP